jgi:hypothetical protein
MRFRTQIARLAAGAFAVGALVALPSASIAKPLPDAAVKQRMIRESIASYPGSCPCPYNAARNGSRCGRRSAYSRPGGYAPLCYASDISKRDVEAYRRSNGL